MRYLSLFSGIEACSVAWGPLGWECAAVAEIEPFPCAALKHHYYNIPNLGDVTKITELDIRALGHIDTVVFGAPCQDLSVAGLRKGLTNADGTLTRSGLFFTACQIAEWANPRFTIYENVPGAFSSNGGRDFAAVVGELSGAEIDVPGDGWPNSGVALGPKGLVEWVVLDAQFVRVESHPRAVPQRRRRVFVIRDSGDWQSRAPLFLEPESLRWNPPPSRSQGQGITHPVAPCIGASGRGFERGGDTRGQDAVIAIYSEPFCEGTGQAGTGQAGTEILQELCPTLNCNHEQPYIAGPVAHALTGNGHDAGEDGTGRGTPLVACRQVAQALTSNYGKQPDNSDTAQGPNLVCVHGTQDPCVDERVAFALGRNNGAENAIAFSCKDHGADATEEVAPTIRAMGHAESHANGGGQLAIASRMAVRRLTPTECERLQGFTDDYTKIPGAKDGPRYKALGNSMAVNVMSWIGKRIQAVSEINQPTK